MMNETNRFEKPSLALKLGHTLVKCTQVLKANALEARNSDLIHTLVKCTQVLKANAHEARNSDLIQNCDISPASHIIS